MEENLDFCPVRNVLSRLGDKWSILVLITLESNGTMRFNEIHRSLGDISHRMLTVTVRMLENYGLVERKVFAQVPPRVEYSLTELGISLIPCINELIDWVMVNMQALSRDQQHLHNTK